MSAQEARTQARTTLTRRRIEMAAISAFSETGFDAATTRQIAGRAGVNHQLISYHYGSKLELWKAAAQRIFGEVEAHMRGRLSGLEGVDEATRLRLLLREFMLYSAEHPELARFMMYEGATPGPRLRWLYDKHTSRLVEPLLAGIASAQERGLAVEGDPADVLYLVLGAVAKFAHPAEVELVTRGKSREPGAVERYVDFTLRLLLPAARESDPGAV